MLDQLEKTPLLAILRGAPFDVLAPLTDLCIAAGLGWIEIALNTPSAFDQIQCLREHAGDALVVGAGTVLTAADVDRAAQAGARFIVSPLLVPEVIEAARSRAMPVFPGATTPREVYEAHVAGATMVKLFPAEMFGPSYLRALRGPLSDPKLLVCGGVRSDNIGEWFAAGANAVAIGASIFRPAALRQGRLEEIGRDLRAIVAAARAFAGRTHEPA